VRGRLGAPRCGRGGTAWGRGDRYMYISSQPFFFALAQNYLFFLHPANEYVRHKIETPFNKGITTKAHYLSTSGARSGRSP
jgi:hypothetical protein